MVEHVGLVVGEGADGVLAEVRVVERELFEIGQAVEVEDFFEGADLVAGEVEVGELGQGVEGGFDAFDGVGSDPELFQRLEPGQTLQHFNKIVADPQRLQPLQPT